MQKKKVLALNVAEAKRRFSDLLGRVAYGGATVLILRRGKPMAKLMPVRPSMNPPRLADVEGWLESDDPFFSFVEEAVSRRIQHRPRVLPASHGARKVAKR